MAYDLCFTNTAMMDIADHRKSGNKAVLKKLLVLFEDISEHPFTGVGKPEPLKYALSGMWSRRVNKEHRIIYEVEANSVIIHSVKGHY